MAINSGAEVVALLRQRARLMPDRMSLLAESRKLLSDALLERIAHSDHGRDSHLHLKALRLIRDGALPTPLQWHPREVLELTRWSLPEESDATSDATRERGHVMRLFACSVLLSADANIGIQTKSDSENPTLAALLESVFVLRNDGLTNAAARHLLFRFDEGVVHAEDRPFFAFGLLLVLLIIHPPTLRSEDWESLAKWVIEEEATSRSASGLVSGPWLLGSTNHDSRHALWRRLGEGVLRMPRVEGLELLKLGITDWR